MKGLMSLLLLLTVFNIYGNESRTAAPVAMSSPPWERGERGLTGKVAAGGKDAECFGIETGEGHIRRFHKKGKAFS